MDLLDQFAQWCSANDTFWRLSMDPEADLASETMALDAIEREFVAAYKTAATYWRVDAVARRLRIEVAAATSCPTCGHCAPPKAVVIEVAPSRVVGLTSAICCFRGFRDSACRVLEIPPFAWWSDNIVIFNGWLFDGVDAVKLNKWRRREINSPWGPDANAVFALGGAL